MERLEPGSGRHLLHCHSLKIEGLELKREIVFSYWSLEHTILALFTIKQIKRISGISNRLLTFPLILFRILQNLVAFGCLNLLVFFEHRKTAYKSLLQESRNNCIFEKIMYS